MGKTARLEYLRRILPLSLAVLGIVGWVYFMTLLSSLMCLVAAAAIYFAPVRPHPPSGAIRPVSKPSIPALDMIGFGLGLTFLTAAIIGMTSAPGMWGLLAMLCLAPGSLALVFFTVAVRQETSWVRFFGNGFEFTQFGLRVRVPYAELEKVSIRLWQASGAVAWFQSTIGSSGRKKAVLLNGEPATNTLVFRRTDGSVFTISSELVPDLQRVLIGMDRAGIELPEGISEWQRNKIRKRRERMYAEPLPEPKSEQLEVARIAALIEHARRNA